MKHLQKSLEQEDKPVLPETLYHSSTYDSETLKPGFQHSGVLVEWDEYENNHFLYATTDKESAIELGFASAIEHKFQLDRFKSKNGVIDIYTPHPLNFKDLQDLSVFLYTIDVSEKQGWMKNNNPNNQIDTEYKTVKHITEFTKEKINVAAWMRGKRISIHYSRSFAR